MTLPPGSTRIAHRLRNLVASLVAVLSRIECSQADDDGEGQVDAINESGEAEGETGESCSLAAPLGAQRTYDRRQAPRQIATTTRGDRAQEVESIAFPFCRAEG